MSDDKSAYRAQLREEILDKIRALAMDASGDPPGVRAFEKETGIRQSEWHGILWARWGDALREAGFAPNQMKGRLDRQFVLKKLAQATRYYGGIPSRAERRMYKQVDPSFPAHNTFDTHFGSSAGIRDALRSWAQTEPAYEDILALIPAESASRPQTASQAPEGYVYLMRSGGFYKVGRSDELERRVKQITVALPESVTLVHAIRTDDPPGIEAYWHRRFADRRANGEWFKLTPSDLAAFKRRKYQ